MKRIQYDNVIDKSTWPQGPWTDEPDKVQWQAPDTHLPCVMLRSGYTGAWCGYVGIPQGHPLHGMIHDDASRHVEVHGGLTYSATCQPHGRKDIARAICHIAEPGDHEIVWWLGFDHAHFGDMRPALDPIDMQRHYRDLAYVTAQCEQLARQLAIIEG